MKKLFYSVTVGSILLLSVVILQSCKKDVATQPTPTVDNATVAPVSALKLDNVDVIDGRLAFKSEEDWRTAIDKIFGNQDNLKGLEAQFKGFKSQKQAQDDFTQAALIRTNGDLTPFQDYIAKNVKEGEVYYEGVVECKLYAQLVNSEGLIQAGDKVYKFTPGFIYEFNVNDMASYRANKNNLSAIVNSQKINLNESRDRIQATFREPFFVDGQKTDGYERNPAITGPLFRRTDAYLTSNGPAAFVPSLAEVRLEHRIRGAFGAWYKEKTDLRFSGTVTIGRFDTFSGTATNDTPTKTVNCIEPNNSDASVVVGTKRWDQIKYVYFAPTNVNFRAIRQTRPVSMMNFSNLNITF